MFQTPIIDMERTGKRIKQLCAANGYSVRDLQSYLQISCPQSIYNWYYGKTLPSLDHMVALSYLLHIPMNWLLVAGTADSKQHRNPYFCKNSHLRRMEVYKREMSRLFDQ